MRRPWLRLFVHGFLAGALLSLLRAPLGLDWTQVPAVSGATAGSFRAGALLGIALSLDGARRAFRSGLSSIWLAAAVLGYALHGFELVPCPAPPGRAGYAFTLLVSTFLLRFLAGPREQEGGPVLEPLPRRERIGLVLAGFGLSLSFETLAHETRLFGLGLSADDTVLGSIFLALLFVGALAFGPLWSRLGSERARTAGGLALAAGACVFGLLFLARLTPEGLFSHLRRFDGWLVPLRALDRHLGGALGFESLPTLDGASIGAGWTSALLAAAAFVLPGFLLGAALGAARHASRIAHALAGAAFGLVLLPYLVHALARPIAAEEIGHTPWSWTLLVAGSGVACAGTLAASLTREQGRSRWIGPALALGALALPWIHPRLVLWTFSPWAAAPIEPALVVPTDAGLITVEPCRAGVPVVTLDRRRMSPIPDEEALDEQELRMAWSLLEDSKRAGTVRALFIGQLTPPRARVLRELGRIELDRTAPWFDAFPALEGVLFRGEEPPPGRTISPAQARAGIGSGDYDWIVAPPTHGPVLLWKTEARELWASAEAPRVERLQVPDGVLGVVWIAGDSLVARHALGELVALALDRLEYLSLAVPCGTFRTRGSDLPLLFPGGDPVSEPGILALLGTMPQQRAFRLESALAGRLALATPRPGGPSGMSSDRLSQLTRGLALHFAAQKLSSPYETRPQQIELEEDELRAYLAALPPAGASARASEPLDPFTRELWESLAWLMTEKRLPDLALVYLEPVAERYAPWPALDRALGRAYRELLEPDSALPFLERALEQDRLDIGLLVECAQCARELGDPAQAAGFLERALAIQPGRFDIERALGLALIAAGDPRGRELVEGLLRQHPDDPELLESLGQGSAQPGG